MKKKSLFVLLLIFLTVSILSATEGKAVVESFSGKVEYQTRDGVWKAVSKGMELPIHSMISTGFNSKAVLNLGRSTLYVEPLSRMSIETLAEKDGVVSTDLFLQVGKVKSEVRSVKGLQTDFKITSPVTTASVRGTVFTFDTVSLNVNEGVVVMTDQFKRDAIALAGESIEYTGNEGLGNVVVSWNMAEEQVTITPDTSSVMGPQGLGDDVESVTVPSAGLQYGSLKVIWNVNR